MARCEANRQQSGDGRLKQGDRISGIDQHGDRVRKEKLICVLL